MNWLGPLVAFVALYLIWHTFWTVLPLIVGIMVGIGLQERFPRLSGLIDEIILSLRKRSEEPGPPSTVVRRRRSTDA